MNRRGHLVFGFIFTIPFIILGFFVDRGFLILKSLLFWFLFSFAADMDFAFKIQHRNFFFHSIIIPILFWACAHNIYGFSIPIYIWSVHLLCDIYQKPGKKPVLGYLIHYKNKALNARQTKQWLAVNGIIGVIIAFYSILYQW